MTDDIGKRKIFAKQFVDKNVFEMALERIRELYSMCDNVSVMFSGGKDSSACLHTALIVAHELDRLPLDVVFHDDECVPPETVAYVERVRAREDVSLRWFALPVKQRNACSRESVWWYPWAEEDRHLWVREMPEHAITEHDLPGFHRVSNRSMTAITPLLYPADGTITAQILGLRAQESIRRLRGVATRRELNYISPCAVVEGPTLSAKIKKNDPRYIRGSYPQILVAKPIYDWMESDVWTAPKLLGWDFNKCYDTQAAAGLKGGDQRVSTPFGEDPLGKLHVYAKCWPDLWEKMAERVPGARAAGRYGRSVLWGHHGLAGWNPEGDPEAMIQQALDLWEPEVRERIKAALRQNIALHYKLFPHAPMPMEDDRFGISWKKLYQIAYRGDFKDRKARTAHSTLEEFEQLRSEAEANHRVQNRERE